MKTVEFKGTIEKAYNQTLPEPVAYSGSFEELEKSDAIPEKEKLTDEDILSVVNNKRKASARQSAMQEALKAAGIEKPTLDDPQVQLREMIKILTKAGRSEEDARSLAETTLGVKLA